ncbi:DUF6174 domain-containing protein [Deinococcus humi]|uniref:Lipoprotein n=1 Tax=Deinococcus humi TaxID=662880 RepID=A0A7W8JUX0_9DEIO|nr:DUF6174 domain-containing protein [Deinococcus humi]MBB5362291.1 hypothetical protein [Deinococcus humi]
MKRLSVLLTMAALVVSACGQTDGNANCIPGFQPTNWSRLSQRTQATKTMWAQVKPTSHRYDLQPTGLAARTFITIGVQSGDLVEVTVVFPGEPPRQLSRDQFGSYRTVDGLFADLEKSINNHAPYADCYDLKAPFDANPGYPTSREGRLYDYRIADATGSYRDINFTVVIAAPSP